MNKNQVYEIAKLESKKNTIYVWQTYIGEWQYGKELPDQYSEIIATLVNEEEV